MRQHNILRGLFEEEKKEKTLVLLIKRSSISVILANMLHGLNDLCIVQTNAAAVHTFSSIFQNCVMVLGVFKQQAIK